MKINKFIVLLITMVMAAGCDEFEYENQINTESILSDLFITNRDFQNIPVITTYEDFDKEIRVERLKGVSKEVTLKVSLDAELLTTYNQQEGTDFKLLPESYYSFPETITFPEKTKEVNFLVNLKPKDLFSNAGELESSNYILPLKIHGTQNGVELDTNYTNIMLNMVYSEPTITVNIPEPMTELAFISGVDIAQEVVLESTTNFTTLEVSKVHYSVNAQDVIDYNNEHLTAYELLPESAYTLGAFTFDNLNVSSSVNVHAALIDVSKEYLLPLRMESTAGYVINQNKPIYIKVKLEEIRLSFDDADTMLDVLTNTAAASGAVTARLNSPLLEEMPIEFVPNSALVDSYNAANGTNFVAINSDKVSVNNGAVAAEVSSGEINYTVDTSDLEIDGDSRYLIALELKKDNLLAGTIVEQEVVYIEVKKSLEGKYSYSNHSGYFWGESDLVQLHPDAGDYKYRVKTFGTTPGWWVGFNLTDTIYNGNPDHLVIEMQPAFGEITTNKSYFDTVSGTLYFDIVFGGNDEVATNTLSDIQDVE